MVTYEEVLAELYSLSDKNFADFQRRIIADNKLEIIGVRTPDMRRLAKKYKGEYAAFASFEERFYEVVFIKLTLASQLPLKEFLSVSDSCVNSLTDWALCDCFAPACIQKNREEYIDFIKRYLCCENGYNGGEYVRRFALTTLLHFYVEEKYLPLISESIQNCNPNKYYVMMAAAWLLAEVLIKHYEVGLQILQSTMCDVKVRNKAISKACDSFRVTKEQKDFLKSLRVKNG